MANTVWFGEVDEDPETGNLYMTIPMELIKALGWEFGDKLSWKVEPEGDVSLAKKHE